MPNFDTRYSCSMDLQPYVLDGTLREVSIDDETCQEVLVAYGADPGGPPIDISLTVPNAGELSELNGAATLKPDSIDVQIGILDCYPVSVKGTLPIDETERRLAEIAVSDFRETAQQKLSLHELSHAADMTRPNEYHKDKRRYYYPRIAAALISRAMIMCGAMAGSVYAADRLSSGSVATIGVIGASAVVSRAGWISVGKKVDTIYDRGDRESPSERRAYARESNAYEKRFTPVVGVVGGRSL